MFVLKHTHISIFSILMIMTSVAYSQSLLEFELDGHSGRVVVSDFEDRFEYEDPETQEIVELNQVAFHCIDAGFTTLMGPGPLINTSTTGLLVIGSWPYGHMIHKGYVSIAERIFSTVKADNEIHYWVPRGIYLSQQDALIGYGDENYDTIEHLFICDGGWYNPEVLPQIPVYSFMFPDYLGSRSGLKYQTEFRGSITADDFTNGSINEILNPFDVVMGNTVTSHDFVAFFTDMGTHALVRVQGQLPVTTNGLQDMIVTEMEAFATIPYLEDPNREPVELSCPTSIGFNRFGQLNVPDMLYVLDAELNKLFLIDIASGPNVIDPVIRSEIDINPGKYGFAMPGDNGGIWIPDAASSTIKSYGLNVDGELVFLGNVTSYEGFTRPKSVWRSSSSALAYPERNSTVMIIEPLGPNSGYYFTKIGADISYFQAEVDDDLAAIELFARAPMKVEVLELRVIDEQNNVYIMPLGGLNNLGENECSTVLFLAEENIPLGECTIELDYTGWYERKVDNEYVPIVSETLTVSTTVFAGEADAPSIPENVVAVGGEELITVSWDEVVGARYTVKILDGTQIIEQASFLTETEYVFNDQNALNPFTMYSVQVEAFTNNSNSPNSGFCDPVNVYTSGPMPTTFERINLGDANNYNFLVGTDPEDNTSTHLRISWRRKISTTLYTDIIGYEDFEISAVTNNEVSVSMDDRFHSGSIYLFELSSVYETTCGSSISAVNPNSFISDVTLPTEGIVNRNIYWRDDADILITGDLTVPSEYRLDVEPGAVIKVSDGATIRIEGIFNVLGIDTDSISIIPDSYDPGDQTTWSNDSFGELIFASESGENIEIRNLSVINSAGVRIIENPINTTVEYIFVENCNFYNFSNVFGIESFNRSVWFNNCKIANMVHNGIYGNLGNFVLDNTTVQSCCEVGVMAYNNTTFNISNSFLLNNGIGALDMTDITGGLLFNNEIMGNGNGPSVAGGFGIQLYNCNPRMYENKIINNEDNGIIACDSSNPNMVRVSDPDDQSQPEVPKALNDIYDNDAFAQLYFDHSIAELKDGHNNIFGNSNFFIYETGNLDPTIQWDISGNYYANGQSTIFYDTGYDLIILPQDPELNVTSGSGSNTTISSTDETTLWQAGLFREQEGEDKEAADKYFELLHDYPESEYFARSLARLIGSRWECVHNSERAEPFTSAEIEEISNILSTRTNPDVAECYSYFNEFLLHDINIESAIIDYVDRVLNPVSAVDSIYAIIDYNDALIQTSGLDTVNIHGPSSIASRDLEKIRTASGPREYVLLKREWLAEIAALKNNSNALPKDYKLYQNYPNPFNPTTVIPFDLPEKADVKIVIYNILGQRVNVLTDKQWRAGHHRLFWNGSSSDGLQVASGMYFVQMSANKYIKTKKLVMIK